MVVSYLHQAVEVGLTIPKIDSSSGSVGSAYASS